MPPEHVSAASLRRMLACAGTWRAGLLLPQGVYPDPSVQFSSVQALSRVRLSATPWTAARQASLSITISRSLLKLMSVESVTPSNRLILCRLLPPSIFPSIFPFPSRCPNHGNHGRSPRLHSGGRTAGCLAKV